MNKTEKWDVENLGFCQRSGQDKFLIQLHQLDILESGVPEFVDYDFGKEMLDVLNDHLSINDLHSVINAFTEELESRLMEREYGGKL